MQVLHTIKELKSIKASNLPTRSVKEIFPSFEKYLSKDSPIAIGVSSGVDSMCLAILLILRHYKKNYPLTNIHIIHCNHKIRTQSEAEEAHIQQFFKGTTLHTFHRNTNEKADENSLRKRRYQCFYQVLQKNNISLLLLGHHLEDRIESTLLNCIRGTGLKGFLNMQIHQNHPLLKFPVYRPLLNSTKKQIIAFCEKFHIKYFEDETNSDITTSQRNILRHEIIEKLVNINSGKSRFLESMKHIYNELSPIPETNKTQKLFQPTTIFPSRNAEYAYHTSSTNILEIRNALGIANNLRSSQIQERTKRLTQTQTGRKEFQEVYFLFHEKQLYIIKPSQVIASSLPRCAPSELRGTRYGGAKQSTKKTQPFRKPHLPDQQLITQLGPQTFAGITIQADEQRFLGATLRFPQPGDKFNGKTRNRRALNQKIPFRRRNFIPIAVKEENIIHMWKNIFPGKLQ